MTQLFNRMSKELATAEANRLREEGASVQDINNKLVRTLKSMSVSKQWFSWAFTTWKRDNPVSVSNCSEAGILTDHCSLLTLNEAIYKFCKTKVNISWMLKKALKRKSRH